MKFRKVAVVAAVVFIAGGVILNSSYVTRKDQEMYSSLKDKYNVEVVTSPKIEEQGLDSIKPIEEEVAKTEIQEEVAKQEVKEQDNRSVENIIWDYLKNAGYTDIQTASIIGNLYQESGLKSDKIEYGSKEGIGIVQWSFGRKQQLKDYCSSQGKNWTDLNCQLDFLVKELKSSQFYQPYLSTFKNPYSINEATEAFCFGFERPNRAKANLEYRKQMAWKAYYNNVNR